VTGPAPGLVQIGFHFFFPPMPSALCAMLFWGGSHVFLYILHISVYYSRRSSREALQKSRERYAEIVSRIPMGRWGNPEELGGVALYLVSEASSYVSGQTFVIDGGWLVY